MKQLIHALLAAAAIAATGTALADTAYPPARAAAAANLKKVEAFRKDAFWK